MTVLKISSWKVKAILSSMGDAIEYMEMCEGYDEEALKKLEVYTNLCTAHRNLRILLPKDSEKPQIPLEEEQRAQHRLKQLDELAPKCAWAMQETECSREEEQARIKYRTVLKLQSEWEVKWGL